MLVVPSMCLIPVAAALPEGVGVVLTATAPRAARSRPTRREPERDQAYHEHHPPRDPGTHFVALIYADRICVDESYMTVWVQKPVSRISRWGADPR